MATAATPKPHLFLDVDGVHGAFDAHVLDLFGATPRALGDAELWRRVAAHPTFWLDMPLAPGAREFWKEVRHHRPTFLTGCPRSDYARAAAHKRRWIERHFPGAPVITCLSRDKPAAMKAPGDVLVDDFVANIRRWERAGGVGVLFRSFPQALREVRRHMGEAEEATA